MNYELHTQFLNQITIPANCNFDVENGNTVIKVNRGHHKQTLTIYLWFNPDTNNLEITDDAYTAELAHIMYGKQPDVHKYDAKLAQFKIYDIEPINEIVKPTNWDDLNNDVNVYIQQLSQLATEFRI